MSGVIDPNAIPIPQANADEVDAAGRALRTDGQRIADTGHDIDKGWKALDPYYNAPEEGLLLNATKPVAAAGEAFRSEVTTVGDALITFAGEIRPIIGRLQTLKGNAQSFRNKIADDDDWRKDEDKVNEHNKLNNDVLAALAQYQAAERACANKITGIFGGTTFVPADGKPGTGQKGYGLGKAPTDVETPWAKPQEHDKPWYEDAWGAVWDMGSGLVTGIAGLVGLHGENGWVWEGDSHFWSNLGNAWMGKLEEIGGLVGLHGENGWVWEKDSHFWSNLGHNWKEMAHSFVPWREWGDRPGYVITTTAINVATIGVGALVKKLLGRRHGGGGGDDHDSRPGDADGDGKLDGGTESTNTDSGPTTKELQDKTNELDPDSGDLDDLQKSLDDAESLPDREPAQVGGREEGDPGTPGGENDTGTPKGNGTPGDRDPGGENTPGGEGKPDGNDNPTGNEKPEGDNTPGGNGKPDGDGTPGSGKPDGDDTPDGDGKPEGDGTPEGDGKPEGDGTPEGDGKPDGQNAPEGDGSPSNPNDPPNDPPGDADPDGGNDEPDPEREQKLKDADDLEDSLRKGGLSSEDIDRLRGDNPRDGDQWQRLASALKQGFGKKVLKANPDLHTDALRFAIEGADNPREIAYRFEYYKARFDEMMKQVKQDLHDGVLQQGNKSNAQHAGERFKNIDIREELELDQRQVHESRPNPENARIDPTLSEGARVDAVRRQAGQIGMGHETSAAYHARKHYSELPPEERHGNYVRDFMDSAERTVREGRMVESKFVDGVERQLYIRKVGNRRLEALVTVRPDGRLTMPTFGEQKIYDGDV
ncbi:hypothetical protein AGRA3207_005474 [Actinomadura graeca]|uniref:Uncharacterized protein n=1 Tax=Actinomadura graeca TaxID=2750812 RepID=A0ABX8R1A3_9ACTN|nr:hypothetical protein [Actinomadura graeca]QXJ24199.1 hypothetical protein AGRA3207_005474 [Actinomadura graeca]